MLNFYRQVGAVFAISNTTQYIIIHEIENFAKYQSDVLIKY